eukprot:4144405-Pyramimonas_sp.AAC.1
MDGGAWEAQFARTSFRRISNISGEAAAFLGPASSWQGNDSDSLEGAASGRLGGWGPRGALVDSRGSPMGPLPHAALQRGCDL